MKLYLKRVPLGVAVVTEAGNILPMQRSVLLKSVSDDVVTVTVEFIVGGDFIVELDTAESSDG